DALRPEVDRVGKHAGERVVGGADLAVRGRLDPARDGDLAPGLVHGRVVESGRAGDEAAVGLIGPPRARAPVEGLAHDLEARRLVLGLRADRLAPPPD